MPEGPEVELDSLHEHIHEAAEHGGTLIRMVALATAIFAALAAIGSLRAGATVNEALLLKTEATQLQAQASDQWAYYQAKGVKAAVAQASSAAYLAAGHTPPPALDSAVRKYSGEQRTISADAKKLEHERDARSAESEHLLHEHHQFANAVALFQVAIALGAVTALTRSRPVFGAALLLGAAGTILFALAFLRR